LRQEEAALQLGVQLLGDDAFRNFRHSNSAANHGPPVGPGHRLRRAEPVVFNNYK
jgi:hypothetical protein